MRPKLASAERMSHRSADASEFYQWILDPEEPPFFVSDEASVFDISTLLESELIGRIRKHYGFAVSETELRLPLWQLLDLLSDRRVQRLH